MSNIKRVAWNKGKKMSPEFCKKMSEIQRGVPKPPRTEEHKRNIGLAHRGIKWSEESKLKLSESMKKLYANKEYHPRLGKQHSEESKRKMSESHKKTYTNGKKHHLKGWHHSEESKKKMSKAREGRFSGPNSNNWKGGIWNHTMGYVFILSPHHPHAEKRGYVAEHRLIVEKYLGRFLLPKEAVHHINKITSDNRPKNLMAFKSNGIHMKFECGKEINPSDIIFDGRNLV